MKLSLLGIAVILFGIAWIQVSTGGAEAVGLGISLIGLIVTIYSFFRKDD